MGTVKQKLIEDAEWLEDKLNQVAPDEDYDYDLCQNLIIYSAGVNKTMAKPDMNIASQLLANNLWKVAQLSPEDGNRLMDISADLYTSAMEEHDCHCTTKFWCADWKRMFKFWWNKWFGNNQLYRCRHLCCFCEFKKEYHIHCMVDISNQEVRMPAYLVRQVNDFFAKVRKKKAVHKVNETSIQKSEIHLSKEEWKRIRKEARKH